MTLLLAAALRTLLLVPLAAAAALTARRPAQALRWWRALLYAGLAMPLLVLLLPVLGVPLLHPLPRPALAPIVLPPAITAPAPLPAAVVAPAPAAAPTHLNRLAILYLGVAALLLLRLGIGVWFGWRLRRRSRRAVAAGRTVLVSELIAVPLTVGLLRPAVVLPLTWRDWDADTLAAVMAHESAHIARGDTRTQFAARLYRALFWFNPLSWWLSDHIEALAEEASDEAALEQGADPNAYAQVLVAFFSQLAGEPGRVWWRGVTMANGGVRGRRSLDRIQRILDWKRGAPMKTRHRLLTAAASLALLATAALAAAVRPVPRMPATPPAPAIAAPLAMIAQPVAAVPAPAAAVEPQAPTQAPAPGRLTVLYFDLTTMTATDRNSAVASAENYVTGQLQPDDRIAVITFADRLRAWADFSGNKDQLLSQLEAVKNDESVVPTADADNSLKAIMDLANMLAPLPQRKSVLYFSDGIQRTGTDNELTLRQAVAAAVKANVSIYTMDARGLIANVPGGHPNPQPPQEPPPGTIPPVPVTTPDPVTPPGGHEARVNLDITIGADGRVSQAVAEGDPNDDYSRNAVAAVLQWTFKPASYQDKPVPATAVVQVNFKPASTGNPIYTPDARGQQAAPPQPSGPQPATLRCPATDFDCLQAGGATPPVPVSMPDPAMPPGGHEISVNVDITIASDGRVSSAAAECGTPDDYCKNAAGAVLLWRFQPATYQGRPVSVTAVVQVNFKPAN